MVRSSLGVTRAKGPAHTSLGQRPSQGAQKTTPSANGAAQFPKSLSAGLVPHRVSRPFGAVSKKNSGCCCQGRGTNSTSVMPGIEMERAFSALTSAIRFPSPMGWAGMMCAFGAPGFAGVLAMPRTPDVETPVRGACSRCRQHASRTVSLVGQTKSTSAGHSGEQKTPSIFL